MHILHICIYRQANNTYTHLNVYFEYIHMICIACRLYISIYSISCVYIPCLCMCVCLYIPPTSRFSVRHHTDSITPSFFSNPRLGSSDRQPWESVLRGSCQSHHHVAAAHSRSNARRDPQVWLHPANGAAEPPVSICTCIPLTSVLSCFCAAPVALFLLQCTTLTPTSPKFLSLLQHFASLLMCLLWVSAAQTHLQEKCFWVNDGAKRF